MKKLFVGLIVLTLGWIVPASAAGTDPLATLKASHPRLLATSAEFDALAKTGDPLRAEVVKRILATAQSELGAPLISDAGDDSKTKYLLLSRTALRRIVFWSMAYRISHDVRFATRAKREMLNVCRFPAWSHGAFLNTAEMAMAVAIGYDWCYDTLRPDERTTIETALMQKALNIAPAAYGPRTAETNGEKKEVKWVHAPHNWNQVCNGGLLAAALAIADVQPDRARLVIEGVRKSLPRAMHSYQPDGAWPEGPNYWGFATTYNVLVVAMLESALGTNLGITQKEPGFAKTANFRLQTTAPDGAVYNFADCNIVYDVIGEPAFGWLARRYGPPAAVALLRDDLVNRFARTLPNHETDRFFPLLALWLPPAPAQTTTALLDAEFHGIASLAVFRSAWNDTNALYLGLKAGTNGFNHSHLDLGSFLLDSDGVRWSTELAGDSYALPQYFEGKRFTYFRTNNFSESVLMPEKRLQNEKATAPIFHFQSSPNLACAVTDLTAIYPGAAHQILRGVFMIDRSRALVQDDIIGLAANTPLDWRMMTPAKIILSADLRNATLTQKGKTLQVELLSPDHAMFSIVPATPPTAAENQNIGYSILQATIPAADTITDKRVAVLLTPVGPKWPKGAPTPTLAPLPTPISGQRNNEPTALGIVTRFL